MRIYAVRHLPAWHTDHQKTVTSDRTYLQGFWPDGLYTPPTAEAWVADIQMAKRLGYNTLRKHVKVEPEQCAPLFFLWPLHSC